MDVDWIAHGKALLTLTAVLLGWLAVQRAFQRAHPNPHGDPDALAGRTSCSAGPCDDDAGGPCPDRETCPRRRDAGRSLYEEEIA